MTPTEAMQAICEAWNRLDNDALADLFTEDGIFEDPLHERTLQRSRGHPRGQRAGMAALSECKVTISTVAESGELGLAEGLFRSALAEGGARFDFPFAMAVEMKDGRIARLTEYFDTAPLV